MELRLEMLDVGHASRFVDAAARSAELHYPWVAAPCTTPAFEQYLAKRGDGRHIGYVALNDAKELVGCVNLNEIVRGGFQSAYLGYYVFAPFDGQGLMKRAMRLVIAEAFTTHGLHRLEANVQPANERSKGLVASLGFRYEGFSPKYLMIDGEWRDHERYAITAEEWHVGE
jgi:[ribosomal protein S5]-alanine N-acetyltransferase